MRLELSLLLTVPKTEVAEPHLRNLILFLLFFSPQEQVSCLATYLAFGKNKASGLAVG